MFTTIKFNEDRINLALWGGEGTTGMVKALNDMKLQNRILIFIATTIVGIISAVSTTYLILLLGGKL